MLLLIHPGTKSEWTSLHSVLAERHAALRELTRKEIEKRKAKAVPLDGLEELDEYEAVAGYDKVELRFLALSEEERGLINAGVAIAQATRAALAGKPLVEVAVEVAKADAAVSDAMVAYVKKAIPDIRTEEGAIDLGSAGVVAAVKATGSLLAHLYTAAREYQALSLGKKKRFGAPPPSTTSESTTAPPATS